MTIQWQEHRIEFNAGISQKYPMLAGETTLKVDNREVGRNGGFHFSEKACGTFPHESKPLPIELQLHGRFLNINYTFKIGDELIGKGRLNLQRRGWACFSGF